MLRVEDGLAVAQRAFFAQESGRREDKEVLRLTKNGRGADKVLEIGGPGTLEKSFACLRRGNRCCESRTA
jgi:NADPH:quinone reductase-like Zn-dependent oxidoreductase